MTHKSIRIRNLMYKGCEDHWGCLVCSECVPIHCYTQDQFDAMECKGLEDLTFTIPNEHRKIVKRIRREVKEVNE